VRRVNIDLEKLSALLDVLTEKDILEFEHEDELVKLRVVRGRARSNDGAMHGAQVSFGAAGSSGGASTESATAPSASAEIPSDSVDVTSPFVGTFYRSPSPDAPSFVDIGSVVRPGQTLCIVEAMKLMNEIEAEVSGTIIEAFAQNGKSVEFGQKLFRVKKA
jgi:acetyl-CoA carboxylase biotin carboxyl carrier protein